MSHETGPDAVNPYAAPQSLPEISTRAAASSSPPYQLYSVGAIVLAAFFGSLLAGGILMAIDYHRLGKRGAALIALVLAIITQFGLLGLIWLLPENVPNMSLNIPQLIVMYFVAEGCLGRRLGAHYRKRGRMASLWKAFGIGLACCAFNIAIIGVGVLLTDEGDAGIKTLGGPIQIRREYLVR
jgi:MFS family permease